MKLKDVKKYWRVWLRLTKLQFESQVANARFAATIFILGKVSRFLFVFILTSVVIGRAQSLLGYNLSEVIFMLALFVWASTLTQLLFRGVYQFRQKVQDGSFDFYLLTPLSPLFLSLFSAADPMDLLLMIPYTYIVGLTWQQSGHPFTLAAFLFVLFAVILMFAFAFTIHTLVVAIGVRYLEVDNLIMLFRDIEKMGSYPIDIYGPYVGGFLTYVIPIAMSATIPAKLVFGQTNPVILLGFLVLAVIQVKFALWIWGRSLAHYTSASS